LSASAMQMSVAALRRASGLHKGGSSRRLALEPAPRAARCRIDERARSPRRLLEHEPRFTVAKVPPGIRVHATEEGPSDASGDTVINANLIVTTIWRRAYVGISDAPESTMGILGRDHVRNNSNGQKCPIVLPSQVPHGKRQVATPGPQETIRRPGCQD
jgi:hypothetical protein